VTTDQDILEDRCVGDTLSPTKPPHNPIPTSAPTISPTDLNGELVMNTDSPEAATANAVLIGDACSTVRCARDCNNECGWDSNSLRCIQGKLTSTSEFESNPCTPE
jgi:hypothetical protein